MDRRKEIIEEWVGSADAAIEALQKWRVWLTDWLEYGGELHDGEFDEAVRQLRQAGLDSWMDGDPADVDALAAAVRGEDLPAPKPLTEDVLIERIFGECSQYMPDGERPEEVNR